MKISLVIPAYNEERRIADTISAYQSYLSRSFDSYELIAVNDGSTDKTLDIIRSFHNVICISYSSNHGKGYAVKRGVLRATGDYIFFTDADMAYSPPNISAAIKLFVESSANGIVGIRLDKKHTYPLLRRIGSDAVGLVIRKLLGISVRDTQCGFKAFDKKTAKEIFAKSRICDFGFDFEIIYLSEHSGKQLFELPVSFTHSSGSHLSLFADTVKILHDIIRIKNTAHIPKRSFKNEQQITQP